MKRIARMGAAIGASGLTGGLLAYPHNLYSALGAPVESLAALATPGLFAAAYLVWLGLLILLTGTEGQGAITWGDMARLTGFASVFLLYWTFATPLGRLWDEPYQLAHVRYLVEVGVVADAPNNLAYFQFPGLALLGTAVALVADVNSYGVRPIVVSAMIVSVVYALAVAYTRAVGSGRLGSFGSIATAHAGLLLAAYTFFFPSTLGIVWFAVVLFTVYLDGLRSPSSRVVVILLFAAATITHAVTPAVVLAGLVGAAIVTKASGLRSRLAAPVVPAVAILVAWLVYGASRFSHDVGTLILNVAAHVLSGATNLFIVERSLAIQTSSVLPLWASLVRWWWTLYLLLGAAGAVLASVASAKARRVVAAESGGILGTIGYSLGGTLVSAGGGEFTRILLYAPLWTTVLWLRLAAVLPRAVPVSAVIVWALSLPTWLSVNAQVSSSSTSPSEISAAAFGSRVLSTLENRAPTVVFMSDTDPAPWIFYLPHSIISAPSIGRYSSFEEYRAVVEEDIGRLDRGRSRPGEATLFVESSKARRTAVRLFGNSVDGAWSTVTSAAQNFAGGEVFDSGSVQVMLGGEGVVSGSG